MFNLEIAIIGWKKQMLAAGINSPTPLDELETHLREEIERQVSDGINETDAFNNAVQEIGQPVPLKTEFKKASGFFWWLGPNRLVRTNRLVAGFWLFYCVVSIKKIMPDIFNFLRTTNPSLNISLLMILALLAIYFRGAVASFRFMRGVASERTWVRGIATIDAVCGAVALFMKPVILNGQVIDMASNRPLTFAFTMLGFISIWLLRPPQKLIRVTE